MKQIITILLTLVCGSVQAQNSLQINELFEGKIVPAEKMVETRIRGKAISKYRLTFFHSVRFKVDKKLSKKIEQIAASDFAAENEKAKTKPLENSSVMRIVNKKQKTLTQMYELTPQGDTHRYLCHKQINDVLTVIYMEGSVSSIDELKKIFKD